MTVTIDTGAIRAALNKTGTLQTWDAHGFGHVSDFWREKINELCDALEATEAGTPAERVAPDSPHVEALVAAASRALHGDVPGKWTAALWLIEEAVPRMRSLNNAASERWLRFYETFKTEGHL